ncbi:MAG: DUF4062 domain-containing protein [Roseitalea sp.]|nr:DUF4062 domain-containing protein [Roseitalea sp.]MBO6951435.1 DUF4062 domain-containing protein [Rhizobiaceae bacterium]MBO6592718.1 DUF4062 domain-containing protein [Roseitalea sp.]MBO6598973.1 DUF4062 domain-containing protein [Roseitalea sp.]MBO6611420.1 DUF4062 domain-containing protein [Roseitalea sp.]
MAASSKIKVMISSRCNDPFPAGAATTLTDIRRKLKTEIEAAELFGKKLFEVWINEETPPKGGTWDSWEVCLQAVADCDILLVISNGNAGWAKDAGGIGICHAELMTGLSTAPGKVWLIAVDPVVASADKDAAARNKRFQNYADAQSLFRGGTVRTVADLKSRVKEALHDALITLTQRGVRESSKGKFHSGEALDWSRLDFAARQQSMIRVLRESLNGRLKASDIDPAVSVPIAGKSICFLPTAIPAALTVAAAKEMVGQPFLRDHEAFPVLSAKKAAGPVHLIACHKTATEAQAVRLLGFPDATVVSAPFGVYVADDVQKIQMILIANCRDETTTRHGVQRFFDWLEQTGEDDRLAQRAQSRTNIIKAISAERAAKPASVATRLPAASSKARRR